MPTTAEIATLLAVLTFMVGVATLAKAIHEYIRQNSLKRFEKFQEISKKMQTDRMNELCLMLEDGKEDDLWHAVYKHKYEFLSIHEEVATMLNSKLIAENVAYYFCGYYALLADGSTKFWNDVDRRHWVLFNHFVDRMKGIKRSLGEALGPDPKTLKY
jgi:hypothetical protein